MKIALVHDYLREYGGAERVLEQMHMMWPEAPVYTSFIDRTSLGDHAKRFDGWDIRTSWVQKNPIIKSYISPLRFLVRSVWESIDVSGFDVVLTSSGWFMCRGVVVKKPALHISYIHHPPRNLYGYATGSNLQKYMPVRVYTRVLNFFLRQYDYETAQRVDYMIANSAETARRVEKFYRRKSTVIYPPVETRTSNIARPASLNKREYFLSVGRLTYAKRIDLAIEACNRLKLPLRVVGVGKEEGYLRSISGPTIEFLGSVSDVGLSELYSRARALLFCALDEDFGIVPVEAMWHGVPVIALGEGGILETIVDGKTGILFSEPTADSLLHAMSNFISTNRSWSDACRRQADRFSVSVFRRKLKAFVETKYKQRLVS